MAPLKLPLCFYVLLQDVVDPLKDRDIESGRKAKALSRRTLSRGSKKEVLVIDDTLGSTFKYAEKCAGGESRFGFLNLGRC